MTIGHLKIIVPSLLLSIVAAPAAYAGAASHKKSSSYGIPGINCTSDNHIQDGHAVSMSCDDGRERDEVRRRIMEEKKKRKYRPPKKADLVWRDEFDQPGRPDPSKWGYDVGCEWGHGTELQCYTANRLENARISKRGILRVRAVREDYGGRKFTSARLTSKGKGDWRYGRILAKVRLRHCRAIGTWPAIWMLPTYRKYGGWPKSGEIDIMEHVGHDPGYVHGTIHTAAYNHDAGSPSGNYVELNVRKWHVYQVMWAPNKIDFLVDGKRYHRFPRSNPKNDKLAFRKWPFDRKFHLILNVAVGGSWGGVKGVNSKAFEGRGQVMEVDWVRVYIQ